MIRVNVWIDGTSCLSSGVLLCLYNILYDPELFTAEAIHKVRAPKPWLVSFTQENKVSYEAVATVLSELQDEFTSHFSHNNHFFKVKIKFQLGDHSSLQKIWEIRMEAITNAKIAPPALK